MGRRASLAKLRSAITHVAAICDKPSFQCLLPQLVLVGENQVSEAQLGTLRLSSPECGHIWRYRTGWMTSAIMVKYVRLLAHCLKHFRTSHRFILVVDALKAHFNQDVLRAAASVDLWVCVIPSKLTWALQPCDTHLFACYKRVLGAEVQRRSGMTATGEVNWQIVMDALWRVVAELMHGKDWSRSFASVGLSKEQRNVSERTLRKLHIEPTAIEVGRYLPSFQDLVHVFPKRVNIPIHHLFLGVERFCRGQTAEEILELDAASTAEPVSAPVSNPWFGRTRSTSALASASSVPLPAPSAQPWRSSNTETAPPLPPPKSPPSKTETATSSTVSLPPPCRLRVPVGRRLPGPKRMASRQLGAELDPATTLFPPRPEL